VLPQTGRALQNIKFQAPNLRVSGVGCQVSGKKNKNNETSVFVIWNFYSPNAGSYICTLCAMRYALCDLA
jgi:hypothetical protein